MDTQMSSASSVSKCEALSRCCFMKKKKICRQCKEVSRYCFMKKDLQTMEAFSGCCFMKKLSPISYFDIIHFNLKWNFKVNMKVHKYSEMTNFVKFNY